MRQTHLIFPYLLISFLGTSCLVPFNKIDEQFAPSVITEDSSTPTPATPNQAPVAVADAASTYSSVSVIVNVTSNDSDPDGDSLSVTSAGPATGGTVVNNSDGTVTYTPNSGFVGADSFPYTVQDPGALTSSATVSITVTSFCGTFTQTATLPFTGAPNPVTPTPDGSSANPYCICNKLQMDAIAADNSLWDTENFHVVDTIDMGNGGTNNSIIGNTANPFNGVFNGMGNTIRNFRFVDNTISDVGLFGVIGATGVIKNLYIDTGTATIVGDSNVGILAGDVASGASITGVHVAGVVQGTNVASNFVGGLIGRLRGAVADSTSQANVTNSGNDMTGGLIGYLDITATVSSSSATGDVSGSNDAIGGLIGYNNGTVSNSSVTGGTVTTTGGATSNYIGGLIGVHNGTLTGSWSHAAITSALASEVGGAIGINSATAATSNVAATGSVTQTTSNFTGGFIGVNYGLISSSYSTGAVVATEGDQVGGFAGSNTAGGNINNCYAKGNVVVGDDDGGGFVGVNFGTIINSFSSGNVSVGGTVSPINIGGFVGSNFGGVIRASYARGNLTAALTGGVVGGFAGISSNAGSEVTNCFSLGDVSSVNIYAGGFIGRNLTQGTFDGNYAFGNVNGTVAASNVGGLIGQNAATVDVTNSYALGDAIGSSGSAGSFSGATSSNISNSIAYGNSALTGNQGVGGFIGLHTTGVLDKVAAYGTSTSPISYAGGLVGLNNNAAGNVSNSKAFGNTFSLQLAGGLIGATRATITNSFAMGSVYTTGQAAAGLIGYLQTNGAVERCFSLGDIFASNQHVAGLVARFYDASTMEDSYSTSVPAGTNARGGVIGITNNLGTASLTRVLSFAVVPNNGVSIGGVQGTEDAGAATTYTDSYYDFSLNPALNDTGAGGKAGVTGATTANLKQQATYPAGFDFTDIWAMPKDANNVDYPKLKFHYFCTGSALTNTPYANTPSAPVGTRLDPVKICTAEQLDQIGQNSADWSKYFSLGEDIDMSPSFPAPGTTFNIIGNSTTPFSGTFDGNGYTISNFVYTNSALDNVGLFGYVQSSSTTGNPFDGVQDGMILNVKMDGVNVTGKDGVGGLVGTLDQGMIIHSTIKSGTVTGASQVGGLVGSVNRNRSYDDFSGALLRLGAELRITRVSSPVTVTGSGNNIGGLVGQNVGLIHLGMSQANVAGGTAVGGLVGVNTGSISESYAAILGTVTGAASVGGAVGSNTGDMTHVHSYGPIPGLVNSNSGNVTDCFFDDDQDTDPPAAGTGLTTANMAVQGSFTNWSFDLYWRISGGYPHLKNEQDKH